jgi:hypothetical protein
MSSRSFAGTTLLGLFAAVVGRPVCQRLLEFWPSDPGVSFLHRLRWQRRVGWPAAAGGAFLGTYGHVWLNSFIHADMHPFAPFSWDNPFLGQPSFEALHLVCVGTGVLGLLGLAVRCLILRGDKT